MDVYALTPAARWRNLTAIIATSVICQIVQIGTAVPLISLALQQRGITPALIGLCAALPWFAVLLVGPLLPRLIGTLGPLASLYLAIGLSVVTLLLFPIINPLAVWFVLNFLLGLSLALRWIVCDIWVNRLATEAMRGRAVGLHETLSGAAIAIGPLILALTGTEGALPFVVSAALVSVAAIPPLLIWRLVPTITTRSDSRFLLPAVRILPIVMLAAFSSGFIESGVSSMLPLYGLALGFNQATAALMLTAIGAGNVTLQYLLGWLADRVNRPRLQIVCGFSVLVGVVLLPFASSALYLLSLLLFLLGGMIAGLYTLCVILVGQRFPSEQLAGAMTALALAYTMGSIVGPVVSGAAMDMWPPHGMLVAFALVCIAFLTMAVLPLKRQSDKSD